MCGSGRADECSLINGWEPAVGKVLALERGESAGVREHHVGRQFLGLAAEPVTEPGAERRAARGAAPVVQGVEPLGMIVHARMHRADERDLIGHRAELRKQFAEFHPALPVL